MLIDKGSPFQMTFESKLKTILVAQQFLRKFKPLTATELASLAVLTNDIAVHLAAALGRVSSTIALFMQIEDQVSSQNEMDKQLLLNIQVLATVQHALSKGTKAISHIVDIEGIQPPP